MAGGAKLRRAGHPAPDERLEVTTISTDEPVDPFVEDAFATFAEEPFLDLSEPNMPAPQHRWRTRLSAGVLTVVILAVMGIGVGGYFLLRGVNSKTTVPTANRTHSLAPVDPVGEVPTGVGPNGEAAGIALPSAGSVSPDVLPTPAATTAVPQAYPTTTQPTTTQPTTAAPTHTVPRPGNPPAPGPHPRPTTARPSAVVPPVPGPTSAQPTPTAPGETSSAPTPATSSTPIPSSDVVVNNSPLTATFTYRANGKPGAITGYVGTIHVHNPNTYPVASWTVRVTAPAGSVASIRSGAVTLSDDDGRLTFRPSSGAITAHGSVSFSFAEAGTLAALPSSCTIDGVVCD